MAVLLMVGSVASSGVSSAAPASLAAISNTASSITQRIFMKPPETSATLTTCTAIAKVPGGLRKSWNEPLLPGCRPEPRLGNLAHILLRRVFGQRGADFGGFADQQKDQTVGRKMPFDHLSGYWERYRVNTRFQLVDLIVVQPIKLVAGYASSQLRGSFDVGRELSLDIGLRGSQFVRGHAVFMQFVEHL